MCQIIALKTTTDNLEIIANDKLYVSILQNYLESKGGDYFSIALKLNGMNLILKSNISIIEVIDKLLSILQQDKIDKINLIMFSRQQPEMEEENVEEQPYIHKSTKDIFAVHGTVYNDKELSEKYNVTIGADTEILKHINPKNWEDEAKGTFCAILLEEYGFATMEHGLKLWKDNIIKDDKVLAQFISTEFLPISIPYFKRLNTYKNSEILSVAFSGGMDISLSVFNTLSSGNYKKCILNYFAWGSVADPQEMASLKKFKEFYEGEFNIEVEIDIWSAETYFNEYFAMNEAPLPKISKNHPSNLGHIDETESPLAYVPYRNTQFALLLSSKAEAKNYTNVDFLFGLNLSEGMVYMDNSEAWLEAVNQMVKYGGKDFKITGTYNVISPYFTRTKTNMLLEFKKSYGFARLEQLLDLSKSCYYPKIDGTPCGKCGSCILREKAIKKIKEI